MNYTTSVGMILQKVKRLVTYLVFVNFLLRRSEASELSSNIGNLFTEPSFDGGYNSKENPFQNSEVRQGKNLGFQCDFKRGYFADVDSDCQIFHICTPMSAHYKFKCPPGTLFNQRYLVCDWPYNVDCIGSERFFSEDNAYLDSPSVYDEFGPFGKELQETQKPSSNIVQRSIASSPTKEFLHESFNINEARPINSLGSIHQAAVSGPFRSETIKSMTQNSARPDAARSLPPKIIFAYTSDPNPEISIPQLLKDIQSREESQRTNSETKKGDSNLSAPSLSQIHGVNSQPESDLKNLPKRQIATILSTLKKLKDYQNNESILPVDKQNETKPQQNHYSFQNVNFGQTTPTKSPDGINRSKISTQYDRDRNDWNGHTKNFVPVTPNVFPSSNPSKPINKMSSIQLQRVNFSPLHEIDNQRTLKVVEIPATDRHAKSQSAFHSSENIPRHEKPSLIQKESTRAPKPSSNRTQTLNVKKWEKLTDNSFSKFLQKETSYPTGNERNLESLPVKIQPNFSVNIGKAKSSIRNQSDENRSKTRSNNNFHHPIKGNGPSLTDDWSMKTVDPPNSRDEVIIPTPVTEFPDIPLDPNSYVGVQSNDNVALESKNTVYKAIASEKFTTLPSSERSAERQTKNNGAVETVYGTQPLLESREILPINSQFLFSTHYSSADAVIDDRDLSDSVNPAVDLSSPIKPHFASSFFIENENVKNNLTETIYHSDKSGIFTTSFPVSKSPTKLRRNRLLNITNNMANFSHVNNNKIFMNERNSDSQKGSKHLAEDVKYFSVIPDLKVDSTASYYDDVTTALPIYAIGSNDENNNLKNLNFETNNASPEYLSNQSLLHIPESEKDSDSLGKQQSLQIVTSTSLDTPLARPRTVSISSGEPLARIWKDSTFSGEQLRLREKLRTEDELPLPRNMTRVRQITRRKILKEILKNRLKDFEAEESENKRRKLTRKTPYVVNRSKKVKSTVFVKENIDRQNSLKINLKDNPTKVGAKDITDENSIPLSRNAIANEDLLSLRETHLISTLNSSVNLHSNENLKSSSAPVNELEILPEFLEFGTKIDGK